MAKNKALVLPSPVQVSKVLAPADAICCAHTEEYEVIVDIRSATLNTLVLRHSSRSKSLRNQMVLKGRPRGFVSMLVTPMNPIVRSAIQHWLHTCMSVSKRQFLPGPFKVRGAGCCGGSLKMLHQQPQRHHRTILAGKIEEEAGGCSQVIF